MMPTEQAEEYIEKPRLGRRSFLKAALAAAAGALGIAGGIKAVIDLSESSGASTPEAALENGVKSPVPASKTITPKPTVTEVKPTATRRPTETKPPTSTKTEVPLPQVWSPELPQQEQKDYLDHLLSETKIDPAVPLGIYRYGSIEKTDSTLYNSPIVTMIREHVTGSGLAEEPVISGVLLPASTSGRLLRTEANVDWDGQQQAVNVPYYLLAIPITNRSSDQAWIVVQILKVNPPCELTVLVNKDGEGKFVNEDSTSYLKPGVQVQMDLSLEGMGLQQKCLSFTTKQAMEAKMIFASANRANPSFWERIKEIEESGNPVTYLGSKYSTHLDMTFVASGIV